MKLIFRSCVKSCVKSCKKYFAIFRIGFLDAVEYRTEFFISIISWGVRLFIAVFLWMAVVQAKGRVGEYDFDGILLYFFITQIISSLVFSRVAFDISTDIHMGDFANYLVKPVWYLPFRLMHELTQNLFRLLLVTVLFGGILLYVQPAFYEKVLAHASIVPLFIISMMAGYFINFCIVAMLALTAFWIINSHRVTFMYFGILTVFSGMLFPLDLFPEKLFTIMKMVPLSYIFFFPSKILQALPSASWIVTNILIPQAIFLIILGSLLVLVYRIGVRRFDAVGR